MMIGKIELLKPELRKSEQKVAELVLSRPNVITSMSMADMAHKAGVSQPTVLRFCRAVGCTGFQDLKIRLIGDLARTIPFVHRDVRVEDSAKDLSDKLFDRTISTLMRIKNQIDPDALDRAMTILAEANRIEFFGSGASGIVAMDGQNKFFRLGVPCNAVIDHHVQCMSAAILKPGAVVVAISSSGRNANLIQSVNLAIESGVSVVSITRGGSPLAERSSTALCPRIPEDTRIQTPMTSRLVHLMLIDVLQVGVALRKGPHAARDMEKAKASLKGKHLEYARQA
jgi:RpiR family carbohydrate utilization transcriptional regulator